MAKLLKIGSAVTEIEDIKIGTPEEIKEGTAKEAEPVSGEVDNSGNWTSITIGDTTASIPQGQSTIKQEAVDKLNAGILDAASIENEYAERFSNDLYIDGNVYFESDVNVTSSSSLYLGEDDTQVAAIDDRVGQYVGGEFKKFGYVEEVETNYIITAGDITEVIQDVLWKVTLDVSALNLGKGKILAINSTSITAEYIPLYVCRVEDETISVLGFLCDEDPLEQTINNISILR